MICALKTILSWDGLHNNIVKHESPECIKATSHPKRDSRALWDTIQQGLSQPKFLQFVHFVEEEEPLNWSRKTVSSLTQPQVSLVSPCYCIPAVRSIQLSERLVSAKTSGWLWGRHSPSLDMMPWRNHVSILESKHISAAPISFCNEENN